MSGASNTGRLWPTPCASRPNDGEAPSTWRAHHKRHSDKVGGTRAGLPLSIAAQEASGGDMTVGRLLSARWVEALMGFPPGWATGDSTELTVASLEHTSPRPEVVIGSMFTGLGGLDLGLEWALYEAGLSPRVAWQAEIDPVRSAVLALRWPSARRHRDVAAMVAAELEAVDVLALGFPCQDLSRAGLGAGLEGPKSGLFFSAANLIDGMPIKPRVILTENVHQLLKRGVDVVLRRFEEIGYGASVHRRSAAGVGAPHPRDRVFIVAVLRDESTARPRTESSRSTSHHPPYNLDGSRWPALRGCEQFSWEPPRLAEPNDSPAALRPLGDAVVPQVARAVSIELVVPALRGTRPTTASAPPASTEASVVVRRHSYWACGTSAGASVVRVEGTQAPFAHGRETVVLVPAVRGSARPMRFEEKVSRELDVAGFLRRYREVTRTEAEALVERTIPEASTASEGRRGTVVDERQLSMIPDPAESEAPSSPAPWAYDAVVLNADAGGAAIGLIRAGFRPVGVSGDLDAATAHEQNAGPCVVADVAAWSPAGKARLVLSLLPGARAKSGAKNAASSPPADGAPPATDAASTDEGEEEAVDDGAPSPPKDARVAAAFRVAAECGAEVVFVEVRGGGRGSKRDVRWFEEEASRAGYRAQRGLVDPAYLGLPQFRPTDVLAATLRMRPGVRWPKPTRGPSNNTAGLPAFETVRGALGLVGQYLRSDCEAAISSSTAPAGKHQWPRLDVDAPSPTVDAGGIRSAVTPVGSAPQLRLAARDVAKLQGLPDTFSFCGPDKAHMRQAATAFPPLLAEALARAVRPAESDSGVSEAAT